MAHHPKPWYRASRSTWYVTLEGVQHNLGPDREKAFERYHALMAEQAKQGRRSPFVGEGPKKLADLVGLYLAYVERERSKATYESRKYYLEKFVAALDARTEAREVTIHLVEQWMAPKTWQASTRRYVLTCVQCAFSWMVGRGYLASSPLTKIAKPSSAVRDEYLRPDEMEVYRQMSLQPYERDVIEVLWRSGCRPQEVRLLEARHYDANAACFRIERKRDKGRSYVRVIYLDDECCRIVARRTKDGRVEPTTKVFTARSNQPWQAHALWGLAERLAWGLALRRAHEAGVALDEERCARNNVMLKKRIAAFFRPLPPYAFRHGFAVDLLSKGVDALTVANLLGHRSTTMLYRVYGHFIDSGDRMRDALRRLNR